MVFFESDYIAGAHPQIMKRLAETNLECLSGYGTDKYCESARERSGPRAGANMRRWNFWWAGLRRTR